MPSRNNERLPHIVVTTRPHTERFTSPQRGGGGLATPQLDRAAHGARLQLHLRAAELGALEARRAVQALQLEPSRGCYLEFQSAPGFELKIESLEFASAGIELAAVRRIEERTVATVFVPEGRIEYFVKRVDEYQNEETKHGKPKNHTLVESISQIRLAVAESFWTDTLELLPDRNEVAWWEVWLRGSEGEVLKRFRTQARAMGLEVGERHLVFPERTVVIARGTLEQFASSLAFLDTLAELRRPGEIGSFFTHESAADQRQWVEDLVGRITPPTADAVAVCILDTGVNNDHPLIAPALHIDDMHTLHPGWGKYDHHGHGTEMAGVALFGDLREPLVSRRGIVLRHRLESAKILPPPPLANRPELYGAVTAEGVARAELVAPFRRRVIAMAITAPDLAVRGQPTSWSSEVDALCVGNNDERRLLLVSAGNLQSGAGLHFRSSNETEQVQDPGQSWNALTVGAYTDRVQIDEPSFAGWSPVAPRGDLAPTTTTSCTWHGQWPVKPDIVMEGGNMALSPNGSDADFPDSLSIVTTHYQPNVRPLTATGDTSAATAAAARFAATIRAEYPSLWPETIRAIMVDSAEWTPRMQADLDAATTSKDIEHFLRCFGFGVPNLERALWSSRNALSLVVEKDLQPFEKSRSNEMHLHQLPWPRDALASLGEVAVELRVTLSYFVEPNPARRGWRKRHRYASHGLRFAMQRPTESIAGFRKRVNGAAREDGGKPDSVRDHEGWLLKSELRSKGSLHHDRWTGAAADLATREHLAVFPVIGWWREQLSLKRWDSRARYSLVVSIRTPESSVDIYEPVAALLKTSVRQPIIT